MNDIDKLAAEAESKLHYHSDESNSWEAARKHNRSIIKTACEKATHSYEQAATDNADWFDQLVNDCAELLSCDKEPTAILNAIKSGASCNTATRPATQSPPILQAIQEVIDKYNDGDERPAIAALSDIEAILAATPAPASEQTGSASAGKELYRAADMDIPSDRGKMKSLWVVPVATPSGGKWTAAKIHGALDIRRISYTQLADEINATLPRDCGEKTAQKIVDLAYRVILNHSGECEIENPPNEMQCLIDAMKSQP